MLGTRFPAGRIPDTPTPPSNLRGPQVHLPATALLPAPSPRLPAFRPKSRSSSRPPGPYHLDAQLYGTFPAVMAPVPGPTLVLVRPNDVTPADPTNRILARVYADDATILVIKWAGANWCSSLQNSPYLGHRNCRTRWEWGRKESAPPSSEKVRGGRIGGCGWEEEPSFPSPTSKESKSRKLREETSLYFETIAS